MKKPGTREVIEPLIRKGMSNKEIAERTGIKYATVWAAAKPVREKLEAAKGRNADRHLCRTCVFRSAGNRNGCDYIGIAGHSRGCSAEDCDRYEKGDRRKCRDTRNTMQG